MKIYNQTDQIIHWLSQVIAKANRTYMPKRPDDGHTNLFFDPIGKRVSGRWIEAEKGDLIFTLNLENQNFEILDESLNIILSFQGHSVQRNVIEKEMEGKLTSLGLRPDGFIDDLHFQITEYEFATKPIQKLDKDGVKEWTYFRHLANETCLHFLGYTQTLDEIRIWPHHFDTGVYVIYRNGISLGFGLAMDDSIVGCPYFYLSGYKNNGRYIYENLPEKDHWQWKITDGWNGAILPLSTINTKSPSEQRTIIDNYIQESSNWFLK